MVKRYVEMGFSFELEEEHTEGLEFEVQSLFEELERTHLESMKFESEDVEFEEWLRAEGLSEKRTWGLDWLWNLNEDAWHDEVVYEETQIRPKDWETWSDLAPHEDFEEDEVVVHREYMDEEEAEVRFAEELDEARWSSPMETTHGVAGLMEVLDQMDRWDVRVDVEGDGVSGVERIVVTSLSGEWDSREVMWRAQESYEPLA